MSGDFGDDFFTPPAFKADDALSTLKRQLRAFRPLVEHGDRFEFNGKPVVAVGTEAATLMARIAKRPAASPEWETLTLKSSADVRKFADDVQRRLVRWQDDDR